MLLTHQVALLDQGRKQLRPKPTGHQVPLPSAIALALQPSQKLPLARGGWLRSIRGDPGLDPPHLTPAGQGTLAGLTNPARRQSRLQGAEDTEMATVRHPLQPAVPIRIDSSSLQERFHRLQLLRILLSPLPLSHHQSMHGSTPEAHPHQISRHQSHAGICGVTERASFPPSLQPDLNASPRMRQDLANFGRLH